MQRFDVILTNEEGLHARPATMFTQKASEFESEMVVYKNGDDSKPFNPKSIFSVLSMGAGKGTKITLTISGQDEEKAKEEMLAFIEENINN